MKLHFKKGEEVVVLAGAERGKRGKVISVSHKSSRAIVEGVKMIKRHTRKSQENPNGAIVEREGTVHVSNLMKAEAFDARASKRGAAAPEAK
ncbi:MAG TPA: 50S ribosomal protein L24 [Candidatus Angelobacter sp.]|nr:50S ribosomal protein L24 [Candidatus Angelobacter sp.]